MRLGLAQINPTVGAIDANVKLILANLKKSEQQGCDLTLFPELALPGYPPEDLILKPAFIDDNLTALKSLANAAKTSALVVGFIDRIGSQHFNAAAWVEKGRVKFVYHKTCLPNYGVFDEKRYFYPGSRHKILPYKNIRFALTICEDIWREEGLKPLKNLASDVILNLSASPYHAGKISHREKVVQKAASFLKKPVFYCNMVGGQDELVFDGGSLVSSAMGKIVGRCRQFEETVFVSDITKKGREISLHPENHPALPLNGIQEIYNALVLGLRDYVNKNGFIKVVLGLSGGIDSSLVATIAVKALGKERVVGVTMPSKYNLSETKNDAVKLAQNLNMQIIELPIQNVVEMFLKTLAPSFDSLPPNSAEENLQARIRGTLLMALSNKFGWLVLTTGNKSETSIGYTTLYGDMAGGFAVIKDVLKTTVYDLAKLINQQAKSEIIPTSVIERAPTAELRENQKDEDSLGPYADLDKIIVGYVEENLPLKVLQQKTQLPLDYARRIVQMIDQNEYKRRQSPPGVKITPRAFGRDHRMPITNRYKQS